MEANIMLIIQVSVATGVIVEILKNFGLNTNILAVVSTLLGALLAAAISGPTIGTIIAGMVIGAGTSGVYDIGKGLKAAMENVGIFNGVSDPSNTTSEDIK